MSSTFKTRAYSDQRGFTLVELSIAMLIALFLLGGLVTVLMGTKRSSGTQTALSQLQDNQRIAMTVLTNVVQKAGYFPYPTTTIGSQQLSSFGSETFSSISLVQSQVLGGTYSATGMGDTFSVRYFTPAQDTAGAVINCAGQSNTGTATSLEYNNVFQIAQVSGVYWLQCLTQSKDYTAGTLGTLYTINLIPNVTKMAVLYGVASTTGAIAGDFSVVQYLNASQMTAANWLNVTSVKVTLTFLMPQVGTTGGQMMSSSATHGTMTFERVIPVMSRVGVNVS